MSSTLVINGALANAPPGITNQMFLQYLANHHPESEYFTLTGVTAAALDWRAILHDTAAVITIGQLIWNFYSMEIAPKEADPPRDSGIYIVIGKPSGDSAIYLGKDVNDRDSFIRELLKRANDFCAEPDATAVVSALKSETLNSPHWKKIE